MTDFFFYTPTIARVCEIVTFLENFITGSEHIELYLEEIDESNEKRWFICFSAGKILPKSERDCLDLTFRTARIDYDGWGQPASGILFKAGDLSDESKSESSD